MALEGNGKLWLAGAGLIGTVGYFVAVFIRRRSFYRGLPSPPHSMLWGHLKIMGEYLGKLQPGAYTQVAFTQMKIDYNLPDVFYIDLWPAGPGFLVCTDPDACAVPTTVNNYEMPSIVGKFFDGNIGTGFIEATNGPLWKHLHQMLAPGLTPGAVKGYNKSIIKEALILHNRFQDIAKSNKPVDLRYEVGKYPFQVIAHSFFGESLSEQDYEDAKSAVDIMTAYNATQNPLEKRRQTKKTSECWARLEASIEKKVKARFAELQKEKVAPTKATATTLLDRMLLTQIQNGKPLESSHLKLILENAKGFVVAGYGTTTDTSSYLFMLLSAFPEKLQKMREEHDRVFDKSFDKTLEMLQENPGLIQSLEYTHAAISETLRLFPIGMVVRDPPSDMKTFEHKGKSYPIQGHTFALLSQSLHYDKKHFDEPKEFKPERFLDENPTFPRNAYRPFERGVRSCMGQALAMDEMKVMMLMNARWFDFKLVDHQPGENPAFSFTNLDTKIGKHAYQLWSYTATPADAVMMELTPTK